MPYHGRIFLHALSTQVLSDAGIDTRIFDVSNRVTYKDDYRTLLEIFREVREKGGDTAQVAFLALFWAPGSTVEEF